MTPPQPLILAVDLGTSGPKVGLVDGNGHILGHTFASTPVHLLPNGGAEQDPEDWWRAVVDATRRLLAQDLAPREAIAGVSITSQWSGTVPVDRDGQALSRAIIWMDARGADAVRRLTGGLIAIEGYRVDKLWTWLRLTGGIPGHSGKDSIAHILYLKEANPDLYARTYKFLEPKDYLNLRLTGRFASTYDAIALHWVTDNRNINQISYHDGLLRAVGVERDKLPDLVQSVDVIGSLRPEAAEELGIPATAQVVGGTPDVQSAAVGSGAVRDFAGHLYVGTSAWITCHVPYKKTDIFRNMASLPSAIPGRYFIANEQQNAGACLTFLRDKLLGWGDQPDALNRLNELAAQAPPGSGGLIFTPWLYGERTPVEDHTLRGGFHNLSLQTEQRHFVRAVFEGVALNARWLLQAVEHFIGRPMEKLHMVGGGAQSMLWPQIMADVLDRPIHQVKDPIRANLRGAGLIGLVGLGAGSFTELGEQVEIQQVYTPNSAHRDCYDDLFDAFLRIYKQNRGIYARMNG